MSDAAVEAALKELRKEASNKNCFICNERGPTYIDMDHSTFVCTMCGGILREFTFKIKGISMAVFSATEVKTLKTAGCNAGGAKIWLARFKGEKPQPGDKDKVRSFIKEAFVSKKYIDKKSKHDESESDLEDEVKPKKASNLARKATKEDERRPRKSSAASDDEVKPSKPTKPAFRISQQSASKPVATKEDSLLDMDFGFGSPAQGVATSSIINESFDDFVSAGAPTQFGGGVSGQFISSSGLANAQQSADPFDFGEFSGAVPSVPSAPAQAQTSSSNMFGSFTAAPSPNKPAPAIATSKDSFGFVTGQPSSLPSFVQQSGPMQHQAQLMSTQQYASNQASPQQVPHMPQMQGQTFQQQQPGLAPAFPASGQSVNIQDMMNQFQGNPQMMQMMMQNNPQMMQLFMQQMMMMQQQQMVGGGQQQQQFPQQHLQQHQNPPQLKPTNPFASAPRPVQPLGEDIFGPFS